MKEKKDTSVSSDKNVDELDWDNRVLCSDGNCIGTIGRDGRCKECGEPYQGELPWNISDKKPNGVHKETATETGSPAPEPTEPDQKASGIEASADDDDWENRRLCSDGNCIGVIGPDGRCKECGKPFED